MRGVDLHPEELLERDARGELAADERERLQAHLDVCAVCRFEVRTREDVLAEVDRAEEIDVQRLLSTVLTPEAARTPVARPTVRRRSRAPRALLLAAALVTIASVAGAAGWTELRSLSHRGHTLETRTDAPPVSVTAGLPPPGARPVVAAPGKIAPTAAPDSVPEQTSPELETALAAAPETALQPAPQPAVTPAPRLPLTLAPSPALPLAPAPHALSAPALGLAAPPSAPFAPAQELTAGILFDRANEARHAGDRAGAIQSYRVLVAQYPASAEAHQALAALGKMLLDGGDAGAALRCFDDYLHRGGPLRQDVMADRALALQRLGRPSDESAAWSALLASYPASVHAERARRRLAELENP